MSKHTPRPWEIGEFDEILGYDCMTCGIRIGPVVLDGSNYGQENCEPIEDAAKDRMIADAKLIAAAPDLLEALIVLSGSHPEVAMASDDELRASIMHCDDPNGVAQAGALLKARAAIKKATS